MKISCLQENLSRGLGVVGRAVASRATLPVTQNVLLSTEGGMLRLSATNLEISITTKIGAMVEEEGAMTVPARLLIDFVNSLPSDRIDLTMEPDSRLLQIRAGRSSANIHGTDASDFPPIPRVSDGVPARISSSVMKSVIPRVTVAAATEDSRPVLTGVNMKLSGDKFTMAAADGFRLAVHHGPLIQPIEEEIGVIIPSRTMNEVERLLGSRDESVDIMLAPGNGQALFRVPAGTDDVEIVSQLLTGTFPSYEQLIPQNYTTRTVLDLPTFQRATRTAAIFARDGSNIIRMQASPAAEDENYGKLMISARSEELGNGEGVLDIAEIEGEESKIAFNSRYLLDLLNVLEQGQVAMETTTSSSPGVFKPIDSDAYVHVVMPMFVQW